MPAARHAEGCPASTFPATTSIDQHRLCLASCPCGFNFRQPDNPVYTAQPGVVTSRQRSWDLVLRSIIPASRAVAVSRTTPHVPLVNCRPRLIFVEELSVKSYLCHPQWVVQRPVTDKLIRLLGISLPPVRSVVEYKKPPSVDPAMDLASFRVFRCIACTFPQADS